MNALRHGIVFAVILVGPLLVAAAEPGPSGSVTVPIHSGNHPDFGRVVFDTPPNVSYRVTRDDERVTVRFSDTVKLGAAPASPRNVLSIRSNAAQVELIVAAGAGLHDMRMGPRVVLDVSDPVSGGAIPSRAADHGTVVSAAQSATVPPGAKGAASAPPVVPAGDADAAADIVAQRGDIKLTAADIRDMLNHLDPAQRAQVLATPATLAEFVRDRLMSQTLLAEAHAAKWDENADVIARVNDARDTVIVQTYLASRAPLDPNYPSQADIAATYAANKERFTVPAQYHVAQIVILVPAGAAQNVDADARRRAEDLRRQVLNPKADFAELASKNSQDLATAGRGGDLGWVQADHLVPALRDVVTKLPENAISEPVRSAEAWHVVKLLGTKPPSVLSLDQVRDALVQALRQNAAQQAARAYVDDMLRKEPIILNEIDLDHRVAAVR
jgi:peptidylprolyl isomerase